ncbi:MAG: PLP-dependent cysteine synthase family protein [Candidatus Methanomethylicus sp.]|nr:PLP-dependent cysteine synthase family protein [Candidatus Methanomethylicus sp.]
MRAAGNFLELIGNTPILRLSKVIPSEVKAQVWCKCEFANPSGSVKDRIALYMIRAAKRKGLKKSQRLLIPTTGNTGIGFSAVGAFMGYGVTIVMPEGMSDERKKIMKAYGAEIIFTPGSESDSERSMDLARRLAREEPEKYYFFDQWDDNANIQAHYETTGKEILDQIGHVDLIVAGIGTGGTLVGTAKRLKEANPRLLVIAMEPEECPFYAKGKTGSHEIEGIGDGFIPEIVKRHRNLIDGSILVSSRDAIGFAKRLAREEGLFVGISSGANVLAAIRLAKEYGLDPDSKVVTFLVDYGARYLSTKLIQA